MSDHDIAELVCFLPIILVLVGGVLHGISAVLTGRTKLLPRWEPLTGSKAIRAGLFDIIFWGAILVGVLYRLLLKAN